LGGIPAATEKLTSDIENTRAKSEGAVYRVIVVSALGGEKDDGLRDNGGVDIWLRTATTPAALT
jgi:hypothetical protein